MKARNGQRGRALNVRTFVCGDSPSSMAALWNWRAIKKELDASALECSVVDVLEHQEEVVRAGIVATPTTVVEAGGHSQRILGTLDDHWRVPGILHGLSALQAPD